MDILKSIEHEQQKNKIPELRVGNTVKVHVRIKEGNKERIQVFEGIIIKKQGGGVNATFTVRRISYGVGVEKTFLVHSPMIEKVELVRVGKARRAKLYYLRDRVGARIENKEVIIKEDIVPGETVAEETENAIVEAVETAKQDEAKVEEAVAKAEEAVKEEKVEESKKEEAKAEEPKSEDKKENK